MRIAITNPTNWPQVRRGTERFINDLARYLGASGHDVTIVSAHPGRPTQRTEQGYTVAMKRRLWLPWMARHGVLEFHAFFLTALAELLRHRYDVVLCCTFMDAYAATLARRVTGTPCVFWVNGLPTPITYVRARSMKGAFFRRAVQGADEVVALSGYMQAYLKEHFGRAGTTIPVPVALDRFPLASGRDTCRPVIACTAALEDRRKGARVLMRAFARVKQSEPGAVLAISCHTGEALRKELIEIVPPEIRSDVHFLGAGAIEDIPQLYARASCSVLASRWEPFGLVTIESLAAGTPVAATRDGAIPEILDDPSAGRLFDPGPMNDAEPQNDEGLARAILECIQLSRDPQTPARCRALASRYSWEAVGPELESLLVETAREWRGSR